MRVRYIIEHGPNDGIFLGLIDTNADYIGGSATRDESIEEAERIVETDEPGLTWKSPPAEWQPDAIKVTQYFDDPGWDNR